MVLKRTDIRSVHDGLHCDLCGSSVPAIRCEKCSNQVFCLSCDDMYHRHPKRRTHVRKAVDVPASAAPKVVPQKEAEPCRLPVPPPRRKKSQKSQQSSPLFGRKMSSQNPPLPKKQFSFFNKVGSLSRMMTGRPLPPVPTDEPPDRPPKSNHTSQNNNQDNSSPPFRKLSSSCSSYSNVSDSEGPNNIEQGFANFIRDRQSPAYANEPIAQTPERVPKEWDDLEQHRRGSADSWNQRDVNKPFIQNQTAYPSSLNKSDADSGIQMGFQGFPTLPKRGMFPNPYYDRTAGMPGNRISAMNASSVSDLPNRPMGMQPMGMQMPQAQSVQGLNYMHPMHMAAGGGPYVDPYHPYHVMPPWMSPYKGYYPPPPDGYQQLPPDMMKRTPSNSSINYACSESGYRLGSYTSMGHLHNPMAMGQFPPYQQPMVQPICPPSPTHSARSARLQKTNSVTGEVPCARTGRRNTAHGYLVGRRSLADNTSSEEDYFSAGASEEEDFRSMRSGRGGESRTTRQWQCEHCTYINAPNTKICGVCCKTSGQGRTGGEKRRRRRDGGVKSPSSGESRPSSSPMGGQLLLGKQDGGNSPDGNVDDIEKSLAKEIESVMAISPINNGLTNTKSNEISVGHEDKTNNMMTNAPEKTNMAVENGSATSTKAEEPQRKAHLMSTGTSPPPQHISTQTIQLSDDSAVEEYPSAPVYRTSSRTSLSGVEREFLPPHRRNSSVHGGPTINDQWPLPSSNSAYLRSSRNSLYGGGQSRDQSPARNYRGDAEYGGSSYYRSKQYPYESASRADYYLNLEELIERRRQETMRSQGFELVRLLREAEQNDFTADDVQVAMNHCGKQNPVHWLRDNWKNMVDTVITLVTNYGRDKKENDIGIVSATEAKEALRLQKGNIWAAVTECVESRQRKFTELQLRGPFSREEINSALTAKEGSVDSAFLELTKGSPKPFQMQIWGPPIGVENESGPDQFNQKSNQPVIAEKQLTDSRWTPVTTTSVTPPFPVTAVMSVDPNRSTWVQSQYGVTDVIPSSGTQDVPVPTVNRSSDFKTRSTPPRVSRTGSFSGGSVRDTTMTTVTANRDTQPEDLYVTVQWASEKKPNPPVVNRNETESEFSKIDAIYTSLEELTSGKVQSPKMPPKFPVNLDQVTRNSDYMTVEFPLGNSTVKSNSSNGNVAVDKDFGNKMTDNQLDNMNNGNNKSYSTVDDGEMVQIDNAMQGVYTTLAEMKAAEMEIPQTTNEAAIDAATESIFATAHILQSTSGSPTTTTPGPVTTMVASPSLPVEPEVSVEPVVVPIASVPVPPPTTPAAVVVAPPPPPQRTEASKRVTEFEQRARVFLAEGKVSTFNEAEIVVKLIDLEFDELDAISASKECSTIDMAISFLQQECELCATKYSMCKMVSMLNCTHRCCRNCAKKYFTNQIRDRNIVEAICPFCDQPDLTDDEVAQEYFNNLDILLKNLIDPENHELFQKKLIDRTLMRDPSFRWCSQCSSGFMAHPFAKRLDCPDCKAVTCAQCRKPWESQHNGITCEQFAEWKEANDPEFQAKGLERHLEENGIDCPSCRFRYSLAKGGCMHFRCLQCKYDFCSGCGQPFKMGSKCGFSSMCTRLGLHSHHPRNCLFYLRDKDPADLQKLLTQNGIEFNTDPPPFSAAAQSDVAIFKCQVMEQKEIPGDGFKDDICGHMIFEGQAGLCKLHYVEYLVGLVNKGHVDPIAIFDLNDLQQEIRRRGKTLLEQGKGMSDLQYRNLLEKIIQDQIPLEEVKKR